VLELGGSDPAVILSDADLDQAVDTIATSRFICAGQSCIAAKRILVEESVYPEVVEKFRKRLEGLKVGDPTQPDTDIGPMARADLRDQLHAQVEESIKAGARCLLGGEMPKQAGSFYPVTLLTDVPRDAAAFTQETFGPVAALTPVKDADDAVTVANASQYGLAAAIWTTAERGEALAPRFEAGQVAINGIVKTDPRLPSGGIKQSGYGRELGLLGIREFVNAQQVWLGPKRG
jgi:succinate-semialdehyde dehydrogenase/glutarate-semialdehyde dehydrogenase